MQRYGVDKFEFEILEEVEESFLKEKEQQFIETLNPTYNDRNANGWDTERYKESQKEYKKTEKYKESQKEYQKKYEKTDKRKEAKNKNQKQYEKTDKRKEYKKEYNNQICFYNGETLTLNALSNRFYKAGIEHPTIEAKKYLIKKESKTPIEFYDVYP